MDYDYGLEVCFYTQKVGYDMGCQECPFNCESCPRFRSIKAVREELDNVRWKAERLLKILENYPEES